jgi:hypothetical protein
MNDALRSLEARVERVERQNRRLRWLLLTLPAVALLAGAAAPGVWEGKKVVAEEVTLKDKDGQVRVLLAADSGGAGPHLILYTKKGKVALAAGQSKDNGIGFVDFSDEGQFKGGVGGTAINK